MAEEWGVEYPVDFRSGGDTTKDAFHKHIQEIVAIYGKLNTLNNGKLDSTALSSLQTELTNHKDSTNPHPNWTPVNWNVINTLLTATNINTLLSKSGVEATKIPNFTSEVNSLINRATGELDIPDAAISETLLDENGYIKFSNGVMVQWGRSQDFENSDAIWHEPTVFFKKAFPNKCWVVLLNCFVGDVKDRGN